jgi:hypothetical protein
MALRKVPPLGKVSTKVVLMGGKITINTVATIPAHKTIFCFLFTVPS